jgi:hypothetical protein
MTFRSLDPANPPRITPQFSEAYAFVVKSGNVAFENLAIVEAAYGISFMEWDMNAVVGVLFENKAQPPLELISASTGVFVTRCLFEDMSSTIGGVAISVSGTPPTINMNVFRGTFETAVRLESNGAVAAIDQNTVVLDSVLGGLQPRAFDFTNVQVCFRNNVMLGVGALPMIAFDLSDDVSAAAASLCGGKGNNRNVLDGAYDACIGSTNCDALCPDQLPGPLCQGRFQAKLDLLDRGLCPLQGSALEDNGVELGLDMVDNDTRLFLEDAPESGAREMGSERTYGGYSSACP